MFFLVSSLCLFLSPMITDVGWITNLGNMSTGEFFGIDGLKDRIDILVWFADLPSYCGLGTISAVLMTAYLLLPGQVPKTRA